jgi:glyoxylase I family protein
MIEISHIDHVVYRVVNVNKVIAFYETVMGATMEKVQPEIGLYQLRLGNALVDLVPFDGKLGSERGGRPDTESANVDHICFRVDPWDEDALMRHLHSLGIQCQVARRYGADGYGPSIYISDPEGNQIELKGPPE